MRTPLMALNFKIELMQSKQPFADAADFEMLRRNVRRLKHLADGVMRLERSKISEIPVRPVPIEVERYVRNVVADLREEAERKGQRVDVDVDPSLRAELDPDLMTDALGNFIDNAIRHTAHGIVRVAVEQAGDRLVFVVIDQGPGLPEEQRNAPFTPSQPTAGGAGLGPKRKLVVIGGRDDDHRWSFKKVSAAERRIIAQNDPRQIMAELRFSYGLPGAASAGLLQRAVLLGILEAPSGFEPEMEVLQTLEWSQSAKHFSVFAQ
jgi:hypothetical protein